jgi:hypothetical protein
MEKTRQEVRTRLEEALKREGIAGSAIVPNVEGSLLWKEEYEKLNRVYGVKLEKLKEQLRTL